MNPAPPTTTDRPDHGGAGPSSSWFQVEGMTCQNCARRAREAAEGVAGVAGATVDLEGGRLRLRWAEGAARDETGVVRAVEVAGYRARAVAEPVSASPAAPGRSWRANVVLGGTVTALLMLAEWGLGWGHQPWYGWVAFALALPVQAVGGARFYRGAWSQLRHGRSNMDTLVALGSTAAFGFSTWVVLTGARDHVYFMEAAAIITLISVGHWLEALASSRAAGAIRALLHLAPSVARRLEKDQSEREVPAADLLPDDRIVVRPGDRIPTDAAILEGDSAVDESMLTGESRPVEKGSGARLLAGTINLDGRLVARVTATGERTVLAQIIAAVERAQNSRAGIQRLADVVSSIFVPVVILLALATGVGWGWYPESMRALHDALAPYLWPISLPETPLAAAILHATAVLIVACPCAMGLATPAAIMAGTNAAALRGVLIRDGIALEKAGRIRAVVFDKTGTLTQGLLQVTAVEDLRPVPDRTEPIEDLAAALARPSAHPVAKALAARGGRAEGQGNVAPAAAVPVRPVIAGAAGGPPGGAPSFSLRGDLRASQPRTVAGSWSVWREWRGRGIEASRPGGGETLRLGSPGWLRECGVADPSASSPTAAPRSAVATVVGLAEGSRLLGRFDLRDALRPEARGVVAALHREGFDVFLLSGDAWPVAESIGREVGIPAAQVLAEVKPDQKADALARLQAAGHRVAFVGDGINDGPALAQADLGIAVSRATDVARESADILLIRPGLIPLLEALGLAQATLRTIHQNLFWAFFYNAAAVPLAMLGFFSPVVCAAAMGLSDLLVIGNALRLRFWSLARRPPHPHPAAPTPELGASES